METNLKESVTIFSLKPKSITKDVEKALSDLQIKPVIDNSYYFKGEVNDETLTKLTSASEILYHRLVNSVLMKRDGKVEVKSIHDFEVFKLLIDIEDFNVYRLLKIYDCSELSEIKDKIVVNCSLSEALEISKEFNSIVKDLYL